MQRFLLVEGIHDENGRGHPVTDPHNPSASPARYAGWQFAPKLKDNGDAEEVDGIIDHYKPAKQLLVDHVDLRAAIAKGHLKLHAEVAERSHDAAAKKLANVAPPTKPNKTTAVGGEK